MDDTTTLGPYLRHERESRNLTLKTISETTKIPVALLEGLEADDISRWPGGIFRRAFVRAYAQAVGLEPDEITRRFDRQYRPVEPEQPGAEPAAGADPRAGDHTVRIAQLDGAGVSMRTRYLGTAADLTVAAVLALGSAAAGSRLLWPVLLIAAYYAVGVVLTGTTPMVALLGDRTVGANDPKVPRSPDPESQVPSSGARATVQETSPGSGPRVRSAF
jgi:hypothetical protein